MPPKKISKSGLMSSKKLSKTGYSSQPVKTVNTIDDAGQGILEGISSLHSWIRTQTMIRPAKLGSGGVKREGYDDDEEEDDDIVIPLTSRDPNMSLTQVRWDHNMGEFLGFNFSEMMIDHLNIESRIHHVESSEAQLQMLGERKHSVSPENLEDVKRTKVTRKYSDESDRGSDPGLD